MELFQLMKEETPSSNDQLDPLMVPLFLDSNLGGRVYTFIITRDHVVIPDKNQVYIFVIC